MTRYSEPSLRNHVCAPFLLFIFPQRRETVRACGCVCACVRVCMVCVDQIGAVRNAPRQRGDALVPRPSPDTLPRERLHGLDGTTARPPARLRRLVSWFRSIISQLAPSAHPHARLLHVLDSPSRTRETRCSLLVSDSLLPLSLFTAHLRSSRVDKSLLMLMSARIVARGAGEALQRNTRIVKVMFAV